MANGNQTASGTAILQQLIGSNLKKIREEEGEKVLRKHFKTAGEELVPQPGGIEILASQLNPDSLNKNINDSLEGKPQQSKSIPEFLFNLLGFRQSSGSRLQEAQIGLTKEQTIKTREEIRGLQIKGKQNNNLIQRASQLVEILPQGVSVDLGEGVKVTGQPEFTPDERSLRTEINKQQNDLSSITTDTKIILDDINDLLKTFNKIPAKFTGPIRGRTIGQFQGKFLQQSPEAVSYDDAKGFFLSNISRKLGGERGVLTDRDIERVDGLFPQLRDIDEVVEQKIARIRKFIKRRIIEHQIRVSNNIKRMNVSLSKDARIQQSQPITSGQTSSGIKFTVEQ